VTWKPFFLSLNTPLEGEDLMEHLEIKYGKQAVARFTSPGNPLDVAGEKVGIRFNKTRRFVNTLNGHRLVEWCNSVAPDKADILMETLFRLYFEEGIDVSKQEELVAIAQQVGLDANVAQSVLNSDKYKHEVIELDLVSKSRYRVSGVPFFVIESNSGGRPTTFSGAQPPDIITEILAEAAGEK